VNESTITDLLSLAHKLGMQVDTDRGGQIIIYTNMKRDPKTKKIREMTDADYAQKDD
jgi:hypothetical protein